MCLLLNRERRTWVNAVFVVIILLVNVTILAALFDKHSTRTSAGTTAGNTSKSVNTQTIASPPLTNQLAIATGALSRLSIYIYIFVVSNHLYSLKQ